LDILQFLARPHGTLEVASGLEQQVVQQRLCRPTMEAMLLKNGTVRLVSFDKPG
jgi:hypothetical protein